MPNRIRAVRIEHSIENSQGDNRFGPPAGLALRSQARTDDSLISTPIAVSTRERVPMRPAGEACAFMEPPLRANGTP